MKPCPRCEGRKYGYGFVTRTTGCDFETGIQCSLCGASGEVSDDTAAAFEFGKELSAIRKISDLSTFDIAPLYGVKIGAWADLEHGRATVAEIQTAIDWLRGYLG